MRSYLAFIAIGSFFATVEEFLTVVILKHDPASYLFTLLILFPGFLTLVYLSRRLTDRLFKKAPLQELAHFLVFGFVGLMIEWFLIGLAPWSNRDSNPLLMLVFQLGMFSFWATVAFLPRLFAASDDLAAATKRSILRFYVPYFAAVYLGAFTVPVAARFLVIITLIVVGYIILALKCALYFRRSLSIRRSPTAA